MRNNVVWVILNCVIVLTLVLSACGTPAPADKATNSVVPAVTGAPASSTIETTATGPTKPVGELVAALPGFGNEYFLPWKSDAYCSQLNCLIHDMLIYNDEVNLKFIPGLAESWETSPDATALTYHLRKGIQFQDGWGEFTSDDVKFTFQQQAKSSVGLSITKNISTMDTLDPYTLVVHFKKPAPAFFMALSIGNSGVMQGIACKKYVETVGEESARQKPIGTGPYKLVESRSGSYFKFEALENHWRLVPEFKTLTVQSVPEISTRIAALKNREIDMATIPAEQMADLKTAGVAVEVSPVGGSILGIVWGGICIPEDSRYDASYHNKDPWVDVRVRKAMSLAIDRQAICGAIFSGGAYPAAVQLFSAKMNNYKYPYDPIAAKQLLTEAGYPKGFSFKLMSYSLRATPETPRLVEALAGFWQQIGLKPEISAIDYEVYSLTHRNPLKNAGEISIQMIAMRADMLDQANLHFLPEAIVCEYQDEEILAIYKEAISKMDANERQEYVNKINQHLYENYYGAVIKTSYCYAWNSAKISPFPHSGGDDPEYFEYVRHAQPINTFRLFTPWPGR